MGVLRCRVPEVGELDPVGFGEGPLGLPEGLAVDGVGRAVRRIVVLEVTPALARLEPGDAWSAGRVLTHHHRQDGLGDRPPLAAELRPEDPPAVRPEPILRGAVDDAAHRMVVDSVVVPVHDEVQVVQGQAPGRVHHLVGGAGSQAGLAFQGEDLYPVGAGALERQGQAGGGRPAVAGGTGVELQEQGLALHFGVARQAPAMPKSQQILPVERPLSGKQIVLLARLLVLDPERLIEHG